MQFEAPVGLSEEELKNFIREECSADFKIDTEDFEYDDWFADLDLSFVFDPAQGFRCRIKWILS